MCANGSSAIKQIGLPCEEYDRLIRNQKLENMLERRVKLADQSSLSGSSRNVSYGASSSNSLSTAPTTPKRCPRVLSKPHNAGRVLSKAEGLHISEVRTATRRALGPSCYRSEYTEFTQPDYGSHWNYEESQDSEDPIPQKYLDEFNRRWHEDDEDNDADQYMADIMPNARWRRHLPIFLDGEVPILTLPKTGRSRREPTSPDSRHASSRPPLQSRFSHDTINSPEPFSSKHRLREALWSARKARKAG